MLCRKKDEGPEGMLYAMKTLRKKELIKRNQLGHTRTERRILQEIRHPFLVHIIYAFQTSDKLYMVLEYMPGGELFHWLKKKRKFSEEGTRLYAAEMGLALGHLHSENIIYRDLKPENILLDLEGHIRITDFGLSKEGVTTADGSGGTKTFCGTPEYLAPEILENKPHGKAVDWWSYGTLLYELMCGLPPFYDQNMQRMYHKIQSAPLRFPAFLAPETKQFLSGLLTRGVLSRMGSTRDFDEMRDHAYFARYSWSKVENKEYSPEIVPKNISSQSAENASHFDAEFTQQQAIDSVVHTTLRESEASQAQFEGFTYSASTLEKQAAAKQPSMEPVERISDYYG